MIGEHIYPETEGHSLHHLKKRKVTGRLECSGGEKRKYNKKADFSPANKHVIQTSREILKVDELGVDIKHFQQWQQLTTYNGTPRNMKLSVSLEIFTCFSFPKISALVLEGISSEKSYGLGYPGGQKWKSQWPHLVLSSVNPTTPDTMRATSSAACLCYTRGGFTKTGWSRNELGVLFASYQLRWGFPEEPMN